MKLFFDRIAFSAGSEFRLKGSFYNRYAAPVQPVSGTCICVLIYISSVCLNMYSFSVRQTAQPLPPSTTATQVPRGLHRALAGKKNRPLFAFCLYKPFKKKLCLCYRDPAGHHGLGEKKSCVAAGLMLRRKAFALTPW